MPTFLWSGRTPSGQEQAEEVKAETAIEARGVLEARGWTGLRLHTTEIHDFVQRQIRASHPQDHPRPTPNERLQYHEGTAPGWWRAWLKSIGGFAVIILVLAGCLVWARQHREDPGGNIRIAGYAVLLGLVVFLHPLLRWWFRRSKRSFVKLHRARTWRRWDEVLRCLDDLAVAARQTNIGIGDFNIARYRALALAGLGRLNEAMTGYSAAAEKAQTPPWLLHMNQASIYITARKYDKALECYRQALAEAPDKPVVALDLGMFLVQRLNSPTEAKQLLVQAEKGQLSELERVYVPYLRGVIAFRERDYARMDTHIREALAEFEKRAAKKFYIFESALLTCKGYFAVASAALGRKDQAKRYFAQSKEYLRLIELNDLLAAYENLARIEGIS
jgi:tetratricopeptide (TPR) repeat protein